MRTTVVMPMLPWQIAFSGATANPEEFLTMAIPEGSIFARDLDQTPANYVPLSPVSFLLRAARIYPQRIAIIHGSRRYTYAQFLERTQRLAAALAKNGVSAGDTVAILAPNIPEMLEAHNAVPGSGRRVVLDQHKARCRRHRVHSAPLGSESGADGPRIFPGHAPGVGGGGDIASGHRHRRSAWRGWRTNRRHGLRKLHRRRRSGLCLASAGQRVAGRSR